MADLQKTVEIIFGGRNDLSKVVGDVERSLDGLNDATQPFADMADDVLRAETAVIGLGVAFAGLSINQAGTFNDQFAEISTLIDDNVSDLGGYRQSILDYANDSTQSLESINGAVYSAISAGVDYTDALGVMNTAEQLAVAGKADLNSTLVALSSVMNAYGAEVGEASDYSDIFFTTVKQGQTTIPELAASLSQVTSVAVAAGVPFDDLAATTAALTATGMPTSQAITSIKAALTNIIKPSSDAQKAAADLGIEFNTTALKTQGLGGFMHTLYEATGGNIETMGRLFGS
ncbi:MAG: phage tail tape measure protein, partial [Desulfuromonadales bacterium]|nr:phage tail tape measure protein [Desulfuromonadales bacterium]